MKIEQWCLGDRKSNYLLRNFSLVLVLLLCSNSSFAQLHNWTFGPLLSTNGIGIETTSALNQNNGIFSNQLSIGLRTLKHDKEVKIQNPRFTNPKPYVYGKLNSAYVIDIGIARCKTLGMSSAFNPKFLMGLQIGPSIGITKPYYVYIYEQDDPLYKPMITTQTTEVLAMQESILGAANWSKGFNQLNASFGVHCDINLQIIWDKMYRLQRLKSGLKVDYFFNDLAILQNAQNRLFTSFYTSYQIGQNN